MSYATIADRFRLEMGDKLVSFQAAIISDGASTRINLPVENVDVGTFTLTTNNQPPVLLTPGDDYVLHPNEGAVDLIYVPPAGVQLIAEGNYSDALTEDEVEDYIGTAFMQHTKGRTEITYDTLPAIEEYLVVLLARIEALWAMATDAAQEVDVLVPDGVSIPRTQRFRQIMELIQGLKQQYTELAGALNVGPFRIEMFNLRRVSRSTNRLVPIYVPQEYDDRAFPTRVRPPIDKGL